MGSGTLESEDLIVANVPEVLRAMHEKIVGLQGDLSVISGILGSNNFPASGRNAAPAAPPVLEDLPRISPGGAAQPQRKNKLPAPWKVAIRTAFAETKRKQLSLDEMAEFANRHYELPPAKRVNGREVGAQVYRLIRENQLKLEKVLNHPNTFTLR